MSNLQTARRKRRLWFVLPVFILPPLVIALTLIMSRPQQVSDALLRTGGQIITSVTDRPQRAAAVTAVLLAVIWAGIGCRCLVECARTGSEEADPGPLQGDQRISPANKAPMS